MNYIIPEKIYIIPIIIADKPQPGRKIIQHRSQDRSKAGQTYKWKSIADTISIVTAAETIHSNLVSLQAFMFSISIGLISKTYYW